MRRQNILRTLLFVVFFGVGAAALSGSILCDDLLQYYTNRQLLKSAEESLNRLKSLNADYDALLQQLRNDPNLVERIGHAILGTEPDDANTIYPEVTPEQLDAARRALMEDSDKQIPEPMIPAWLSRCRKPSRRIALFVAGAFLILISFICFGSGKQTGEKE
ncbi:MAG: hypothetical protein ACYSW4_01115 [Planctomycetota bacterium]|jgi:hypothetical protein